jgi:hypothetical protein
MGAPVAQSARSGARHGRRAASGATERPEPVADQTVTRQQVRGAVILLGLALLWTAWRLWQLRS